MEKIIEVTNLRKYYGDVKAVDGIDFYVEKGAFFAFLGPNGAGKSTTINMLCTFMKPDSGEAAIDGASLGRADDRIRSSIGVVFQDHLLDALLTVRENLTVRGSLYGLRGETLKKACEAAAAAVNAGEFLDRPYGKLSGGQKRRADIARALVHAPKILFLDEPTTGLDPQTRKSVWNTVRSLQAETGMTVFLTTHYMEEAAEAGYVTIIDKGRIAARGTPAELKERYARDILKLAPADAALLSKKLDGRKITYKSAGGAFSIPIDDSLDAIPLINEFSADITGFEVYHGTMDDVFIAVTGEEIV